MVGASSSDDKISNLDLGNPLHLQTSDFNSNTIISVKLTRTENYRVWAAVMKLVINTRNKTSFLDGTCLKSTYANSAPLSNQEFDIMTKLPKCSCAAREDVSKHNQLIKLMQFLMGLNDVFQLIRSSLLARETLPDVKDSFAIVSREESHRGITSSSSSNSVTKPQVSSFAAKSNSWNNSGNKKFDNNKRVGNSTNNRGPNPNLHCTNCGKVGHTVDRCFDIIGYPLGYNKNIGLKSNGPRTFNVNFVSSSSEKGHPNGTLAKIKYVGNLKLSDKIVLYDVLVVPEYCDFHQNKIVGAGSENGGLYMFDYVSPLSFNSQTIDLNLIKDSHVSPCDICHKDKQTREPFPFSDHQTTKIDELIHLDLWGPYKHSDFQTSLSPNDDGRVYDTPHNDGNDHSYPNNADECENDFATSIGETSTSDGQSVKNPNWIEAMNNEIEALNRNNTWTICDLPEGRKAIGSKWLWKIKYKSSGEIKRYKARVMSKFHYSLFTKNSDNVFIILLVYVDDIVVTGNNVNEIKNFKQFLKSKFQIKDLEKLKYFLGIEVLDTKYGICLSQRKYCLELLHEFGLLAAKHVDTPLAENATLNHTESDDDHLLVNVSNYQRLVGKLIYLTNTRPDIPYDVHCLIQYMHYPLNSDLDAALRVLRYLKGSPGSGIQINKIGNLKLRAYADYDWAKCHATRKSVSGYCVFLGDSLVTWKRKKQSSLSRSSAEAEYGNMASTTFEVIWLSNLLSDMGVKNLLPVVMYCDNSSALQIAANPVFHEKSKHFEIDVHLVRKKLLVVLLN
ncbi:ribonuclease H-like domain-containing protein [Tanacetum coccineum]|uniref:Ribonuclease H-like domain-containing protein n=1 Tax=Tanacetum coccineum TaxID=301880 RepID=A0ABQ5ISI6_9ASTR